MVRQNNTPSASEVCAEENAFDQVEVLVEVSGFFGAYKCAGGRLQREILPSRRPDTTVQ